MVLESKIIKREELNLLVIRFIYYIKN